jgi:hypothetical protein
VTAVLVIGLLSVSWLGMLLSRRFFLMPLWIGAFVLAFYIASHFRGPLFGP